MSDKKSDSSDTITAEFRDGRLQIVEVSRYDKDDDTEDSSEVILPDLQPSSSQSEKKHYVQVVDNGGKGVMHLDLLNFTLIKCEDEDSEPQYKLVANDSSEANDSGTDTVTCVLQSSDGEEQDGQDYVMVESTDGPLLLLQSAPEKKKETQVTPIPKKMTPAELIERAKLLQKAKALTELPGRGRKRKRGALPPPHELLASPNFKLFLYSCKFCSFKCNAIRELTAHRASEHGTSSSKWRSASGISGRGAPAMQCAKCPYRGTTYGQFMKHVKESHLGSKDTSVSESTTQILVCGSCGFETPSRSDFHKHINTVHNDIVENDDVGD